MFRTLVRRVQLLCRSFNHISTMSNTPDTPAPPPPLAARRLGACELPDDDHFCALEALLMQLGVKEVALLKASGEKAAGDTGEALLAFSAFVSSEGSVQWGTLLLPTATGPCAVRTAGIMQAATGPDRHS
jgi:hypothetical protein